MASTQEMLQETRWIRAKTLRLRRRNLQLQLLLVWVVPAALCSVLVNVIDLPVPVAMVFATGLAALGGSKTMYQWIELAKEAAQARAEGVPIEDP